MFYVLIFAILAVVLVAGGITGMSRRRKALEVEERHTATSSSARRNRKRKRAQSSHDRSKRH
jgi:hypothetical protein